MDFSKLKAFIVVAEELNFRKSAEILGMSQPPLSRLIASLEEELSTKLFERTTRNVRLTGAGVLLLKEAREIESALSRIQTDVRAAGKARQGSLKIGFSTTAFLARFPVIIEEFQLRYPKVSLDLQQATAKEILQGIASGKFHLGFVESETSYKDLQQHCVSEETLGVLLPKKHPLAKRKEIEFFELQNETIILHHKREAEEFHKRISKLIQGMSKKPKIYIKGDGESCPILVATGKGVSLTIEGAQKSHGFAGTSFIPIKGMFLPVSVFWDPEEENESLKTFLSTVVENKSLRKSDIHCLHLSP